MCLYVQGAMVGKPAVFTPTANVSIVGKPCSATSPNQLFSWQPSSQGGKLVNVASNQAVTIYMANNFYSRTRKPLYKFKVSVKPSAANTGLASVWYWTDSTLRSAINPLYQITSSKLKLSRSNSAAISLQNNGNKTITSSYMTGTAKPIWFWTATCL